MTGALGHPRLHLRRTGSTNERARALAAAGAPSGTLVTASEQTAGRGRQGRTWWAPTGSSLLMSLVLRWPDPGDLPTLLPLIAGAALCDVAGEPAALKWPNDVVMPRFAAADKTSGVDLRTPKLAKLAGILVESRPQEGWAVVGIGMNVAVRPQDVPADLSATVASLELSPSQIEPLLARLLAALGRRLGEQNRAVLDAWRARDALYGREIEWEERDPGAGSFPPSRQTRRRTGRAQGIDDQGRLLVRLPDGAVQALSAGEVHLGLSA